MGATRDKLNAMKPGQSFAFPDRKLFIIRAEIKDEPNTWVVRRDPAGKDAWRIWRNG